MRITRNQLRQIIQEELIQEQNQGKTGYASPDDPSAPSGSRTGTGRGDVLPPVTISGTPPLPVTDRETAEAYLELLLKITLEMEGPTYQSGDYRNSELTKEYEAEAKEICAKYPDIKNRLCYEW